MNEELKARIEYLESRHSEQKAEILEMSQEWSDLVENGGGIPLSVTEVSSMSSIASSMSSTVNINMSTGKSNDTEIAALQAEIMRLQTSLKVYESNSSDLLIFEDALLFQIATSHFTVTLQ